MNKAYQLLKMREWDGQLTFTTLVVHEAFGSMPVRTSARVELVDINDKVIGAVYMHSYSDRCEPDPFTCGHRMESIKQLS